MKARILIPLFCVLLAGCTPTIPVESPVTADLPNPASAHCEQQGYRLEIRTAEDGGQFGVCIFPDGSECEEWAYFRGVCGPAAQSEEYPSPTDVPSAAPINPADYQGWWAYTHPVYGFSLLIPPDWVADDTATGDSLLSGHLLHIYPQDRAQNLDLRLTFRRVDENDVLLWPTGVGSGEFIPQGTLEFAGGSVRVIQFVCPGGQVQSIWFHGDPETNIRLGDVEFGSIFNLTGFYCQEVHSLDENTQRLAEMIVASLQMP